jgi:drug/metabolite transporter (DMT)-like permease
LPANLLYALTVLIWGTSWLGIEFQVGVVPPEVSVAYRHLLAAVLLAGFCLATGRRLRFRAGDHLYMALQGLTLFSLNYFLFYVAAAHLASGLMAVAFSTITVMNILNGAALFRHPVDARVMLAAVAGLAGLALIFWPEVAGFEFSGEALLGLGLSLLGTYSASLGNMVAVRQQRTGMPLIESNALGMAYGALFALVLAVARGAPLAFDWSIAYVGSLVWLAVFASVIGFGCYLTLLRKIGADRAAYATVLFPLVALGISTLVEGYRWTPPAALGVALVLLGNLVVLSARRRTARAVAEG